MRGSVIITSVSMSPLPTRRVCSCTSNFAASQRSNQASAPILHVYLSKYSPRPLGAITEQSLRDLPPPGVHPLVRTHPDNGRKALFLNPVRMESIVGMEDTDALALIEDLMRHATQTRYEYRHKWRHGDWVLWDNRSVLHQANPATT
jgi:alpha-ketoglutarate-dependent taurine dioxygenase